MKFAWSLITACVAIMLLCGCNSAQKEKRGMAYQTTFSFQPYKDAAGNQKPNPPAQRIYGPVSHVGQLTVCSYVIETTDGLVVVDPGYDKDGDLVPNNIRSLGLDPTQIKLILITHWHGDHSGGTARLVKLSAAKVMVHEKDADVIETGKHKGRDVIPPAKVSRRLKDGDVIEHGGLKFKTIHTPGQSAGEVVYLVTVPGPQGPARLVFGGDATGFKDNVETLERIGYPGVCQDYRRTVEKLRALEFDCYLGGHGHQVFQEARPDGNPFITRDEWLKLVNGRAQQMEAFVKKYPKYLDW